MEKKEYKKFKRAQAHNNFAFAVYKCVGNTMMIDISSASSKARAREKVRSLVVASHRKQEANQVSEREREDPIARQHRRARERERRPRRAHDETARERREGSQKHRD